MKFSLVCLLVISLTGRIDSSPLHQQRSLTDDLDDFLSLLPLDKIIPVVQEYLQNDREVQEVLAYIKSEEFKALVAEVEGIPDVVGFLRYLDQSGLDIFDLVNKLNDLLGLPPLQPVKRASISGGMAGLVNDVVALLPLKEIEAMYNDKLKTSEDFKNLVERLKSPKFQTIIDRLAANKEVQYIVKTLREMKIDVDVVFDIVSKLLGVRFPGHAVSRSARSLTDDVVVVLALDDETPVVYEYLERSLVDDMEDFLGLLPMDKLIPVVQEYVQHDKEVQEVIKYMTTEDFQKLAVEIANIPDVVEFGKYLEESGLDMIDFFNKLNELIGLPPMNPIKRIAISGGMAGLVADVKALLPLKDIEAMYYDKLKTSENFKHLIERLRSPKLQALVNKLAANKEVQHILKTLKEKKIEVDMFFDLVTELLGVNFPGRALQRTRRSLADDFEDFVALVPLDKVLPIVNDYLQNDHEVQQVLEYVKSQEFKNLVTEVERIEDVLAFYNYLQEAGLDVYDLVNKLHEVMSLPPLVPHMGLARATRGIAGLIADVKAVLPLDKFQALYDEKLASSPEFKDLIVHLSSPKFQAIIDRLLANDAFRHIVAEAKKHGVHVDLVADLLSELLGLKFPKPQLSRDVLSLKDDLADFLALIPQEEIMEIVMEYMAEDKDFQHAVDYVQSAEFRALVKVMEEIDDVRNFYNYIQESGVDIYGAVNKLHDFIGLPPLTHPRFARKITGGLNGLIQDIKAILPINEIKALYHRKMETSSPFKNLIQRLNSPKFQVVIDALFANKEFQLILKAAKEAGVDVEKVTDLLSTIFGLKFPAVEGRALARSLYVDLQDFMNLLPKEKIAEIFFEYLENDKEIQYVMGYIQSPEFRKLVNDVETIEDVVAFFRYLDDSGLDIYDWINELNKFVGLPRFNPRSSARSISGGLAGLISDIIRVLPLDQLNAMYNDKLANSPPFQNLMERLRSPKLQAVVDTLLANEEFQNILDKVEAVGVDVQAIADFLSKLLDLQFPESRAVQNIQSELEDFLLLLPIDQITKIGLTYLMKDAEVQDAAQFIRTDEFKKLLMELQMEQDIADFLKYMEDSGLSIYNLIDFINDVLGVPHYPRPSLAKSKAANSGVQGMLNEIRAILPYEKIRALYEQKLRTSENFRVFIRRFKAPEFQAVVDRLTVNQKFVELGYQAYRHGISIEHITSFLQELLGLKFPEVPFPPKPRNLDQASELSNDLADFLNLLPVDKIVKVSLTYTFYDEDTKNTIEYMRSEEFRNIVRTLDKIPEYNKMLKALDAAGLDVYEFIQVVHKFIGLDDKHPFFMQNSGVLKPGLSGLIEELKKLIPYEQIKELYYFKLAHSKAFAHFVDLVKSNDFQVVTNTLFANKDFQHLLLQAKAHGVDLQAISDFFLRVLGITTPPGIIS